MNQIEPLRDVDAELWRRSSFGRHPHAYREHRTEVTLYEALRRKHGKSKSRAVQHALRYIEEH
jgi:hypothetical protein